MDQLSNVAKPLDNLQITEENLANPVGTLKEKCEGSATPMYSIVQSEGECHAPTFSFKVTLGNLTAMGTGNSKKCAKHATAKAMLDLLRNSESQGRRLKPTSSESDTEVFTKPSIKQTIGNSVGDLQEMCAKRGLQLPSFQTDHIVGMSHNPQFYMTCVLGEYREMGMAGSKNDAKRDAAQKMIQRLIFMEILKPLHADIGSKVTKPVDMDKDSNIESEVPVQETPGGEGSEDSRKRKRPSVRKQRKSGRYSQDQNMDESKSPVTSSATKSSTVSSIASGKAAMRLMRQRSQRKKLILTSSQHASVEIEVPLEMIVDVDVVRSCNEDCIEGREDKDNVSYKNKLDDMRRYRDNYGALIKEKKDTDTKVEELKAKISALKTKNNFKAKEIANLKATLKNEKETKFRFNSEAAKLTELKELSKKECDRLKSEKESLCKEVATLKMQITRFKNQEQELKNESENMKEILQREKDLNAQNSFELVKLKKAETSLQDSLKDKVKKEEDLDNRLKVYQQNYENKIEVLGKELKKLSKLESSHKSDKIKFEAILKLELKTIQEETEKKVKMAEEKESQIVSDFNDKLKAKDEVIVKYKAEIESSSSKSRLLKRHLEDTKTKLTAENEQKNQVIKNLEKEFEINLLEEERRKNNLQLTIKDLKAENESLKSDHKNTATEKEKRLNELNKVKSDLAQKGNAVAERKNKELEDNYKKFTQKYKAEKRLDALSHNKRDKVISNLTNKSEQQIAKIKKSEVTVMHLSQLVDKVPNYHHNPTPSLVPSPVPPGFGRTLLPVAPAPPVPRSPRTGHADAASRPSVSVSVAIKEKQLFDGLKVALEEAKQDQSSEDVLLRYGDLFKNLLDSMPDDEELILKSLDRAFLVVFGRTAQKRHNVGEQSRIQTITTPQPPLNISQNMPNMVVFPAPQSNIGAFLASQGDGCQVLTQEEKSYFTRAGVEWLGNQERDRLQSTKR